MRTRKKELISDELKPFVGKLIKENQMQVAKITKHFPSQIPRKVVTFHHN